MNCPHRQSTDPRNRRVLCAISGMHTTDDEYGLCRPCESEWVNNTPPDPTDRSTWTPTLLSFVELERMNEPIEGISQEPEAGLPSLVEMTENFAVAIAKWTLKGWPVVDEATFRQRLITCQGDATTTPPREKCVFWNSERGRCTECGCKQVKLHLATEKCPVGKWPATK